MIEPNRELRHGHAEMFEPPEYLLALGNFIVRFSDLEGLLNAFVWKMAALHRARKRQVARALIGPLRIDAALEKISRFIAAGLIRGEMADDLEYMSKQIRLIGSVRNDIVHLGYANVLKGGRFVFDNKMYIHYEGKRKRQVISAKTLNDMTTDLLRICREFHALCFHSADDIRMFWLMYDRVQGCAWRYKPPTQSPPGRSPRPVHRIRLVRPKPSAE